MSLPNSSGNIEQIDLDALLLTTGDKKGILQLATHQLESSSMARSALLSNLHDAFHAAGLPAGFYDVMSTHKAVVSGSFVPFFVNPSFAEMWGGNSYVPKDIDLYVGKGKLADVLDSLARLPDVSMEFLSKTRAMADDVAPPGTPQVYDAAYYNNGAIQSMVRLRFESENGAGCYVDVMESKSASPLMCLTEYDLSHLRAGISSDGLFILHPTWHEDNNITYISPKLGMQLVDGELRSYSRRFIKKYEDRGYNVVEGAPLLTNNRHVCYSSTECPLTLRSTTDDGVRFVPFTDEAAKKLASGQRTPIQFPNVHWRHGGECTGSPGKWENPTTYDDDGVVIDHHQSTSSEATEPDESEKAE